MVCVTLKCKSRMEPLVQSGGVCDTLSGGCASLCPSSSHLDPLLQSGGVCYTLSGGCANLYLSSCHLDTLLLIEIFEETNLVKYYNEPPPPTIAFLPGTFNS